MATLAGCARTLNREANLFCSSVNISDLVSPIFCFYTSQYYDNKFKHKRFFVKFFSKKKTEKKESCSIKTDKRKTKRKRNKSRRVAGQTQQLGEATFLPCHYAVSFWLGGVVAVRLTFAAFLFFFGYTFQIFLLSKCL